VENTSVPLFAVLLLLTVPVFFLFLSANSVWDTNEAFYVETPRQMVRSGDYINPTFNGAPRFNKPVLSYWIVAGLYRAFGDSVTSERVGIGIGAAVILVATFLIGRALRSTVTGLLAALIVATAPRFVWFARKIFIDVYLTTFTSVALAAFVLAEQHPRQRRRYLSLMYVALGLGVLTKGPVALVIPALVCVAWLAAERRLTEIRRLMLLPGIAVLLVIVLPWYAAVYAQHGWSYIRDFLFQENLQRYATTAMTPGSRGVLFYLPVLFGDLFPWAPLVLVPLIAVARSWRSRPNGSAAAAGGPLDRLLWIWIVLFVGIFSFSRTKEDLYIFPIVPAVAVLVASVLTDAFAQRPSSVLNALFLLVSGLCIAAAPGLYWLFGPDAGYYALPEVLEFAAVLALSGAAALVLWVLAKRVEAVTALAGGFVLLNYLLVGYVLPGVERSKPIPPLVRTLEQRAAPNAKLGYFNMGLQSFVYYANRGRVEDIGIAIQAKAFFLDERESWALMGTEEWEAVRQLVPYVCVVDRHPLSIFDAKMADIVDRRPPEDVLLVKNHCDKQ
jgi:4-amino-4-deoxy-L-arabinose transferase-like glycosyltransferase